jgi:2-polyprenyl-3-methyl-5-hydroxy-6-metoxy-1,4-benzoquinol methylase
MKSENKNCPYCGKSGYLFLASYSRKYYRCYECDLLYRDIPRSYDDVVATYHENFFDKYSTDQLEGQRFRLYDHILELIGEHRRGGTLLDVGAGCGFFLAAAQKRGWEVRGIDPSSQSVEVARQQNGLDVFAGTLEEYAENGQFDVITFINVLDHSTIPWVEIDRARELLRPGGLIYLRFPNGFLHSRIYRMAHKCGFSNSSRKLLVFHEYSFTPKHIRKLLRDHGFVQTTVLNSHPSEGDPYGLFPAPILATQVKRIIYSIAKCIEFISFRQLFLGTSLEVIAIKPNYLHP